ncbi:MAG TPA: hypothetical protein VML75_02120 [Kofleriaceae bacterium]|nr:hypothetical protein [Kofleriaceae bacterium]
MTIRPRASAGRLVTLLVVALAVVCAGRDAAAAELAKATVLVEVGGAAGVPSWRVDAIGGELRAELKGVERLKVVEECAAEGPCADVLLRGTVAAEVLRYELRFMWPDAPETVHRGAFAIAGTTRRAFAEGVHAMLEPLLRPGAALDRRGTERQVEGAATIGVPDAPAGLLLLALALVGALLGAPFAFARGVSLRSLRSFRLTVLVWGGLGIVAVALTAGGERLPELGWLVFIGAGLAWGWFAASVLPMIVPPLAGLSRVEYGELARYLRPWAILASQRLVRVILWYAPVALALHLVCVLLDVSLAVELGVLAPVAGLLVQLAFASLVEVLTLRLDRELVAGEVSLDDPWQAAARGYVMGYVRRVGWPDADDLLDDIHILPGRDEALAGKVVTYGGGVTPARIVVPQKMLEMALAPYGRPHDYAAPRVSKLHWTEWNAGLVVPVELDAVIPTREQRQPRAEDIAEETEHQPLGEPPTVAGYVEPDDLDKRNDYRPEEDPLWLDWDAGEEYDGTDASDKDFLFGAVVREIGAIQRRDDQLLTVGLALRGWAAARSSRLLRLVTRFERTREIVLARYPTLVADEYAALNFARHHLIQYLAWQEWHREDQLSARAYAPELERHTADILATVDAEMRRAESTPGTRPSPVVARLAWLSELVRAPVRNRREILVRRIATATIGLACAGALGIGVAQAIGYRDTYVERMEQERQRLEPPPVPAQGPSEHDQGN